MFQRFYVKIYKQWKVFMNRLHSASLSTKMQAFKTRLKMRHMDFYSTASFYVAIVLAIGVREILKGPGKLLSEKLLSQVLKIIKNMKNKTKHRNSQE